MSAKKLQITDTTGKIQINFNCRYEKMDREKPVAIEHKVGDKVVGFRTIYNDTVLLEGMTKKAWVGEDGVIYDKEQVKHYFEGKEVAEKAITKVFEITGFQSLSAFTDSYVIEKYYELFADDDGRTKDFDKGIAQRKNLVGMRKLWEFLHSNQLVARAEFNASSAGFTAGDGYIRAVSFGNKWALELACFKEEKVFHHLQEEIPTGPTESVPGKLKIKRI